MGPGREVELSRAYRQLQLGQDGKFDIPDRCYLPLLASDIPALAAHAKVPSPPSHGVRVQGGAKTGTEGRRKKGGGSFKGPAPAGHCS